MSGTPLLALSISVNTLLLSLIHIYPLNPQTVEDLRFALGQDIHVLIAPDYQISERINELYGGESRCV